MSTAVHQPTFARLVRSELRKLTSLRSTWIISGLAIAFYLLISFFVAQAVESMIEYMSSTELAVFTSGGTGGPRLILVGSALIPEKATRDTAGINMVTLKKNARIAKVRLAAGLELKDPHRYRVRTLPAAGALLRQEDTTEQMSL